MNYEVLTRDWSPERLARVAKMKEELKQSMEFDVDFIQEERTGPPAFQMNGDDTHLRVHLWNFVVTDDVAAVTLRVCFNGSRWEVDGSSKRSRGDKPDQETGFALALGRAVSKLGRQIERQGKGRVRNAEWVRAERRKRHARKRMAKAIAEDEAKSLDTMTDTVYHGENFSIPPGHFKSARPIKGM